MTVSQKVDGIRIEKSSTPSPLYLPLQRPRKRVPLGGEDAADMLVSIPPPKIGGG